MIIQTALASVSSTVQATTQAVLLIPLVIFLVFIVLMGIKQFRSRLGDSYDPNQRKSEYESETRR